MPVIRHPNELAYHAEEGWVRRAWAGTAAFGTDVPMTADRHGLAPGTPSPPIPLGGQEAMVYVIAGSGTARAGGEDFPLAAETMLWLAGCSGLTLTAAADGLDVLIAESAAARPEVAPLRKVFPAGELPHLVSTRDTRDRLDLVTGEVPVGATLIRADRISYHPGDTAAAHYHQDCHHVFCVLAGSGLIYAGQPDGELAAQRLAAGDSALVGPGEVHWFENDTAEKFSFVEFWAPPPAGTVWTVAGDRCTWAPAG